MEFKRISIKVTHSVMMSDLIHCFEHEIPIYQARFGNNKVIEVTDGAEMAGPVQGDYSLQDEWTRLMERPGMVQVGENQATPAPLVAFPRGVLDLEDFYARIRAQPENVTKIKKDKPQTETSAIKADLDALGIEYRGNASTESLKELLASVENESGSAGLQNQG